MTKIRLMSDLHLEFMRKARYDYQPPVMEDEHEQILVLAGDIANNLQIVKPYRNLNFHIKKNGDKVTEERRQFYIDNKDESFVSLMTKRFKAVVYVPGNHDYYGYPIEKFNRKAEEAFYNIPNAYYFYDGSLATPIDGVRFIGATLWTDLNNLDPFVEWRVSQAMADYKYIRREIGGPGGKYPKLKPRDIYSINAEQTRNIFEKADEFKDDKIVVISHHAPSMKSNARKYGPMTHAYCNELDDRINARDNIVAWVHGHTHDNVDYNLDYARVTCNCFGYYPTEVEKDFDPYKVITV